MVSSIQLHPDVFTCGADMLVNTTNRRGTMARGLALQFRNRFPTYYQGYQVKCQNQSYGVAGSAVLWDGFFEDGTTHQSLRITDLIIQNSSTMESCKLWAMHAIASLLTQLAELPVDRRPSRIACPLPGIANNSGTPNPEGAAPTLAETVDMLQLATFALHDLNIELVVCHPGFESTL